MFGAEAKSMAIKDTKMHYVVFGIGEKALLIIPGLSDGLQNVEKFPQALFFVYREYAKRYKVFVCSRKNQLPAGYTTREMAEDILFFMKSNHINKADVIGISMGGMIAQHLAAEFPQYVNKLIIAVSSPKLNQASKNVVENWKRMIDGGEYEHLVVDTIEKTYSRKNLWKYRPFYFLLKRIGKPQNPQNFLAQANACLEHNAFEQLETIKSPTLVVGGEKDQIVGGEASRILAQKITSSQLMMYPGLGHDAFQDSKQVEKDSIQFLERRN